MTQQPFDPSQGQQPIEQQVAQDQAPAPDPGPTSQPAPTQPAAPAETQDAPPEPVAAATTDTGVGALVTWEVSEEGSDFTETFYGLVIDDGVELGQDETGVRVAVLHDLRVLDVEQLQAL